MKTDRQLLELAAKAHGFIDDQIDESDAHGLHRNGQGIYYVIHKRGWYNWCPLEDDGAALRLAVKLRIKVRYNEALGQALAWPMGAKEAEAITVNIENCGDDECEATRRAIVRAAAIGEAME